MFKYRRVYKEKDKAKPNEIRVTANTMLRSYLGYVANLLETLAKEKKEETIVIKGTGYVISKAISLATLIRHRFKGLKQIVDIGTMDMVDEYEPMEEEINEIENSK